ncbi:MAG: hypothetical protein NTU57_04970 [Candidatus Aenigmarchaeota archaeon]|nr:hypothetical protein [Candidatus Aenigmarchaeota archaeon]
MDYWEKKIAAATMGDPVQTLKKDKMLFKKLKAENDKLREEKRKLLKNNDSLVKLVELMEEKVRNLTIDMKKTYSYSYEKGGWVEKGALDEGRIELAPSQINIDSINNQLAEILKMVEKHRMKE